MVSRGGPLITWRCIDCQQKCDLVDSVVKMVPRLSRDNDNRTRLRAFVPLVNNQVNSPFDDVDDLIPLVGLLRT